MPNVHKAGKVPESKKEVVKKIADLIKKYPIIGALNMENLPAAQLQRMKSNLRDKVEMFMAKRRLMKLAIEQAKTDKKGIEKIEEHLKGMPALLFTEENPFKLFRILKKSKSKAPAKGGQTAPADITVKAGPTPFAPGPVIGELGQLGIKTKVDAGKISILEDSVVCKEGEEISENLAGMLTRLGIEPMEIGLDLVAVYEKGDIFTKSILDIDEDKFMADLSQAASWAFNLSVETAFVTGVNREFLIQKAFMDSKALAISQNILADAVAGEILAKAEREMLSLKSQLPEAPAPKAEEKKEEVKAEEPKVEEKKEEKPVEAQKEEPKPEEKAPEPKAEEKPKPEAPKVEEKPKEPVKEEPKVEEKAPEPKPKEEKVEEKPAEIPEKIEEPKAEVAKAEEKAPEPKPEAPKVEKKLESEIPNSRNEVSRKVENIVEQAKLRSEGKPIAEKLVEDVEKEAETKQKNEKAEMKKVEELAQTLVKKGTLQNIPEEEEKKEKKKKKLESKIPNSRNEVSRKEKKEEKKPEVDEVEELTKQLMKKGTLRK